LKKNKTLASHLHVVLIASAEILMDKVYAPVYLDIKAHHQVADLNVSLVQSVLKLKHATVKNALILALELVVPMLSV
jgi:hypothetical protein